MKFFSCKKAVLFFLVCIITLTFCGRASAFSAACDSCLASCSGLPSCCTGSGCLCQDECSSGNCGHCQQEKWYCTLYGDCWVIGCEPVSGPTAPRLVNPVDSVTGVSTNPALTWNNVSGAISYDIRVCANSTCSPIAASSNVSVSQWQVSPALNPSTTYWWQVRANNSCASGSWSTARKFTTACLASPTDTPVAQSPAANSTGALSNTTLNWSDVACTATYDVRICSNSTCSSTVRTPAPTSASQWQITPPLNPSTTYWWQVRANNAYGSGSWSTVSRFTTSSDTYLSNSSAWNDSITAISRQRTWKYYFIDLESGASSLVIDLYNLAKDADLYVKRGSKPTGATTDGCRSYKSGNTSEKCTINTPLSGTWWIGVNNWDTGTISYTVKANWISPPCTYSLSPQSYSYNAQGNTGTVTVNVSSSACSWTATSGVSWLTVNAGSTGTGTGTVSYSIAANSGSARTGTIAIGGQTYTVFQAGWTYSNSIGSGNSIKVTDMSGNLGTAGGTIVVKAWDINGNEIDQSAGSSPLPLNNNGTTTIAGTDLAARFPAVTPALYAITVDSAKYIITNVQSSSDGTLNIPNGYTSGMTDFTTNSVGTRNSIKITDMSGSIAAGGAAITVAAWDSGGNSITPSGSAVSLKLYNHGTTTISGTDLKERFPSGTPMSYKFTVASSKYVITNVKNSADGSINIPYSYYSGTAKFVANSIGQRNTIKISDVSGALSTPASITISAWDVDGNALPELTTAAPLTLSGRGTIIITGTNLAARFSGTPIAYEFTVNSSKYIITNVKSSTDGTISIPYVHTGGTTGYVTNSVSSRNTIKISDASGLLSPSGAAISISAWDADGNSIPESGSAPPLTLFSHGTTIITGSNLIARFPAGTPVSYDFSIASTQYVVTNLTGNTDATINVPSVYTSGVAGGI
jgi:hypothetical protein